MAELMPTQDAWLRAQQTTETFSGFSAHEIETMPMDEYAWLTGRKFVIEPVAPPQAQGQPGRNPTAVAEAQPEPIDFAQLSMSEYKHVRERLGIGRSPSARGIFGS